jgi:hypothetical protein
VAANYGALKTDIATWLARSDLTSAIPTLALAGLARLNNELVAAGAIPDQEANGISVNTVANQRYVTLDSDRAGKITRAIIDGDQILLETDYNKLIESFGEQTGKPQYYALTYNDEVHLGPIPDAVYSIEFSYSLLYPTPAGDSDTNNLLLWGGNLWLYASLIEGEGLLFDDPRMPVWVQMYKELFNVFVKAQQTRYRAARPAPLVVDVALRGGGAFNINTG